MKKNILLLFVLSLSPFVAHMAHAQYHDEKANQPPRLSEEGIAVGADHISQLLQSSDAPLDNGGLHLKKVLHYTPSYGTDVLGIKLGMTAFEAVKVMRDYCQIEPTIRYSSLRTIYKGINIYTQDYASEADCVKAGDRINVTFAAPVSESVVIKIVRNLSFSDDNSPLYDSLISDLSKKYGFKHLFHQQFSDNEDDAIFMMKDGTIRESDGRDLGVRFPQETMLLARGVRQYLTATITKNSANLDRASMMVITLSDISAQQQIQMEAIKQMQAHEDELLTTINPKTAL